MSKKIHIICDSTCDLPEEVIKKYNIEIVPLFVTLGDKTFKDGVDIVPDDIYENYNKTKVLPKTAAVSPGIFEELFNKALETYDEVIYIGIGSGLSTTYQSAVIAADGNERIFVLDSQNLSTGIGLLVLKIISFIEEGKSGAEIKEQIEALVPKVDASFVIDSLEYLYKGGRCSALSALGANFLKLKPCIEVLNGKMGVGKKYRGQYETVLKQYVDERLENTDIDKSAAFITHAGVDNAIVEQLKNQVIAKGIFEKIYVTRASCTISSHCGKNTLGVLLIRNENK
ncbi:MAG: DegV family protein [Ruminococcaceae bacterium]|nr:DegV family protein [Oscillospiraceae bacterium]